MTEKQKETRVRELGVMPQIRQTVNRTGYVKTIENLFQRMPVMKKVQLKQYLRNTLGEKMFRGDMEYPVNECLRRGILMSDGNYLFTKQIFEVAYRKNFAFNDLDYSSSLRVQELLYPDDYLQDLIVCFNFVLEVLPYSEAFMISSSPFPISFIDREKNMLIQVCHYPNENIIPFDLLIKNSFCDFDDHQKECISRIAIVDDPATTPEIGYYGFSSIVSFSENDEVIEMMVVEKRNDNRWG